jgi:hypothetical protein
LAAATLLGEGLRLSYTIGMSLTMATCLITFGGLAEKGGAPKEAAQLLGAGDTLLKKGDAFVPVRYQGVSDRAARTMNRVRAAIGENAFATAFAAGRALSLDAAIAVALDLEQKLTSNDSISC